LEDKKEKSDKETRKAETDAYLSGTPASSVEKNEEVLTIAETMPEFPGGDKALYDFLKERIRYPAAAVESSVQGTVYVSFIVETNGALSHINVVKGIGSGCDEEAVRAVSEMPQWKPAKQGGKAVRLMMNLPVQFRLD
jgi:protein TonB